LSDGRDRAGRAAARADLTLKEAAVTRRRRSPVTGSLCALLLWAACHKRHTICRFLAAAAFSVLVGYGSLARADYFDFGPNVAGCGKLRFQDLAGHPEYKVPCSGQRCTLCGGTNQPACPNDASPGWPKTVMFNAPAGVTCAPPPIGLNCTSGANAPAGFVDCYGCYDPSDTDGGANPTGTRYEARRFYTTQCDFGTGTTPCTYVAGLSRVKAPYYNPLSPPTKSPVQTLIEQRILSVACVDDTNPLCSTVGCGTLQSLQSPTLCSVSSDPAIPPSTASCPTPQGNPITTYANWKCIDVVGVPTCAIDKNQTCDGQDGPASTSFRISDGAGSVMACVGQLPSEIPSLPPPSCGLPSEPLPTDTLPPWFDRTSLGDRTLQCNSTTLKLDPGQLPAAVDLGNWISTCFDKAEVHCTSTESTSAGPLSQDEVPGSPGGHLLTCTATDLAGRASNASLWVRVAVGAGDTTPPVFDAASLAPQTWVGNASGAPLSFTLPTASDVCTAVTISCAPLASNGFGSNQVPCTATDGNGNQSTATLTVIVLEPLHVVFEPQLSGAAGTVNKFTVGRTIPFKVHLLDTGGQDVTSSANVTVKLAVTADGDGSSTNLINDLDDFNGVGDAGGLMVLVDGHYQFNLQANRTDYAPGGQLYRSLVTVSYDPYPTLTAGQASAALQSR
jgi:hypothetical protein